MALNLPKLAQFLKYLIAFSDDKKDVEGAIKEFESKMTPIKEQPIPFKSPGLPVKRHKPKIDYSKMHSGGMASGTSQRPPKIRKVTAMVPRELGPGPGSLDQHATGTDMHISSDSSTQDDATGTDNDSDVASGSYDKENQAPNGKPKMDLFRQDRVPLKLLDMAKVAREFRISNTYQTPPTSGMYLSIISFFKCCMVAQWATKNFEPKKIYF